MKYSRRTFIKGLLIGTAAIQMPFTVLAKALKPSNTLNSRLLLNHIQRGIKNIAENFVFEINDSDTRILIRTLTLSFMSEIRTKRHINDYYVVCDELNNPEELINNNQLRLNVVYTETKNLKFNKIEVTIGRKGIEFNG